MEVRRPAAHSLVANVGACVATAGGMPRSDEATGAEISLLDNLGEWAYTPE
jgi:hypothetical protein